MLEGDKLRDFLKSTKADECFKLEAQPHTPECAICGLDVEPDHPHTIQVVNGEITQLDCVHHFCAMLLALGGAIGGIIE